LSKTKTIEEKSYYLNLAAKQRYSERDFARIIDSGTYERTVMADTKLSALLTEFPISTRGVFKDSYVFEFLGLPENHKEHDLRRGLVVSHLKQFLKELGPDFTLIGEEYPSKLA
jgi:predicted nuclease of restriction endonuclease-like (RecB) superfamily